ncbi:MAG: hypothetical protein PHE09_00400 [Oscillospiraceae bacterium]|nr:hypothetical protein [Oscillospiraceae bacterium]
MDKIIKIYIAKADTPESEASASLSLPAEPFALFDALDKAGITQDDTIYFEVEDYFAFECMEPFIADSDNLLELNVLCQKLSQLDERQGTAFEGLLKMEVSKKDGSISVGRLIDLAYSTDCCHVVSEATGDESLGRFYAENGFVPAVENLPENVFKMLNFSYIGKEMRTGEGGVFTQHGYVVQHTELIEAYKNMKFTMRTPDYQILLEDMAGNRIELPCQKLPTKGKYTCMDCRIPQLMSVIDAASMDEISDFAEMLKDMGDRPMLKYKAVLHATGCESLEDAVTLANHLDEYMLDYTVSSRAELAKSEVEFLLGGNDTELLTQYLNLYGYGKALMERDCSAITSYGLLEREDHQPMQAPLEQNPNMGLEMK